MTTTRETATWNLRLERLIHADQARVFAAWTEPELLARWSAPEGLRIERGDADLRPGGAWSVVMVEADGTRHEAFGVYREVEPPARLVYTHAWRTGDGSGATPETLLTVEFRPEGDDTRVVLVQQGFASRESRDGHRGGWSSAMDHLEEMFAR